MTINVDYTEFIKEKKSMINIPAYWPESEFLRDADLWCTFFPRTECI